MHGHDHRLRRRSVSGSVTTTGFKGTIAHIHQGAAGAIGPVNRPFTKDGDTYKAPGARS
jgi:hypothetical protein